MSAETRRGRWRYDDETGEVVEEKPAEPEPVEPKPTERDRAVNPGNYL